MEYTFTGIDRNAGNLIRTVPGPIITIYGSEVLAVLYLADSLEMIWGFGADIAELKALTVYPGEVAWTISGNRVSATAEIISHIEFIDREGTNCAFTVSNTLIRVVYQGVAPLDRAYVAYSSVDLAYEYSIAGPRSVTLNTGIELSAHLLREERISLQVIG